MLLNEAYKELEEVVGPENVSREPAVLDGYAYQPLWNLGPDMWVHRPVAVVLPSSTEEVQDVVRACNKHGLKFKALSSGWGAIAGPGCEGVVQIDLRRMDRILEIDEKNMYAVVEPCAIGGQIRAEAMKAGLHIHMISAGAVSSPLASATSAWGCSWDGIAMGWSQRNVLGVEWVLPTGDLLNLGSLGSDCGWFCGDGPGPSLRGIMRGRCGGFGGNGVFTKCAIKLYNWPGPPQPELEGLFFDMDMEVPENIKVYWIIFHDRKSFADATYEIAKEGIGYNATKISLGTFLQGLFPHIYHKKSWKKAQALKKLLLGIQFSFLEILATSSQGELEFQEMVLRKAVSDHGGIMLDAEYVHLAAPIFWGLVSGGFPPVAFRASGMFNIGWGQDEVHDAMVSAEAEGEKIKKEWIAKEYCLDDLGDSSFHFFC